jgi:TPR repeat protein
MYDIGCMYSNGDGVERDLAEGARWVRRVAELGFPYAETALAGRYLDGEGVERDPVEALKWMRKAAEQGYAFAEYSMGKMYEEGTGTQKDPIEALAWYNLAPTSGLADHTNHRELLEAQLGPEAAQEARRRATVLRAHIREIQVAARAAQAR